MLDRSSTPLSPVVGSRLALVMEGLKRVIVPFALSRLLFVFIFSAIPIVTSIPFERWSKDDSTTAKMSATATSNALRNVALSNDAAWYLGIAQHGYEQRPFDTNKQANWAFFPLHPLLWKAAAAVTGEWFWSGIAVANIFMLAALSLLWVLALQLTGSRERADDAALFAAFWPAGYFTLLPQTEPVFFALVLCTFLAARGDRWWQAGIAGALATVTRLNGLFVLPALFLDEWYAGRRWTKLLKLAPVALGLAAFMAYLWSITGNPLAFKDIQVAWGRHLTMPWAALLDYTSRPLKIAEPWNPKLVHFFITVVGIASAVACWRRGWRGLAVFTLLTLLAPLSTGTLMSLTRYMSVAPGVYLALSAWSGENRRFGQLWLVVSCVCMTLLCTAYAAGLNLGGA